MLAPGTQSSTHQWGISPHVGEQLAHTFDVPVDDHVAVQVGHAFQDLPRVLPGHIFRQCTVGLQLVFDGTLEKKRL